MVGKTLGHYRIDEQLGAGGMGVVYKALDPRLNRTVAIKVLPPQSVADPGRRERFIQEARAASALEHPNIVTIYEIDEVDSQYFIVMQYVAGKSIRQLLARGPLPLADALRYAVQAADALARAHARGIVHRDLKPDNVMVTNEGLVKVLDFGLATLHDPLSPDEIPTGMVLTGPEADNPAVQGTPSYMSPEQAMGKKVGARSDIFSFGSLLYEMITGRRPFPGQHELEVMTAIIRDEPERIGAIVASTPPELEKLISRAMRKDPERRWQSMADLRVALTEIKEESESWAAPPGAAAPRGGRVEFRSPSPAVGNVETPLQTPKVQLPQQKTEPMQPMQRPKAPAPSAQRGAAWRVWAVIGVVIGIVISLRFFGPGSDRRGWATIPFTTAPGAKFEPAISPDGSQVAFVWEGEQGDNLDIFVKPLEGGAPRRLTTNPLPDFSPAWSPDGGSIAFVRHSPAGSEILMTPAAGGGEQRLGQSAASWFGLSWFPDGKSLATVDRDPAVETAGYGIFLLNSGGPPQSAAAGPSERALRVGAGEKRRLTTAPDRTFGDWRPAVSPDGKMLAFTRSRHFWTADLYVLTLSGGAPQGEPLRITKDEKFIWGLTWTPDSSAIVFSSNRGGKQSLWRVAAAGGAPQMLNGGGENAYSPSLSVQGGVLAFARAAWDANVWRIAGPAAETRAGTAPQKIIASPRADVGPNFSPDNGKIALASDRSGHWEVWVTEADGSKPVQITSMGGPFTGNPRWSHDARFISFESRKEGNADIYVIAARGGEPRRLTTGPADEVWPSWSRDGRWVYFGSNPGGAWNIWKAPAEGGSPVPVTRGGGYEAFESPDGQWVYYTKLNEPGIWRISAKGGDEARVLDQGDYGFWGIQERGIYFFNISTPRPEIQFFSFATQRLEPLAGLPKQLMLFTSAEAPAFAVSPDGRFFAYAQLDHSASDVILTKDYR